MSKAMAPVIAVTFSALAAALVLGYSQENDYNNLSEGERASFQQCAAKKLKESWEANPPEKAPVIDESAAPDHAGMTKEESLAQLSKDLADLRKLLDYAGLIQQEESKRRAQSVAACAREQNIDPATIPSP
jgi:hypothetical protein